MPWLPAGSRESPRGDGLLPVCLEAAPPQWLHLGAPTGRISLAPSLSPLSASHLLEAGHATTQRHASEMLVLQERMLERRGSRRPRADGASLRLSVFGRGGSDAHPQGNSDTPGGSPVSWAHWSPELDLSRKGLLQRPASLSDPLLPAPAADSSGLLFMLTAERSKMRQPSARDTLACLVPGDHHGVTGAVWAQACARKARLWQLLAECQCRGGLLLDLPLAHFSRAPRHSPSCPGGSVGVSREFTVGKLLSCCPVVSLILLPGNNAHAVLNLGLATH